MTIDEARKVLERWDGSLQIRPERSEFADALRTVLAEVDRLNKWADGMTDAALKERATGEEYQRELRTENERLRKDAERYQWLRDHSGPERAAYYLASDTRDASFRDPDEIDRHVDAAMERKDA